MNKKLIRLYLFLIISISLIVYLRWDRRIPFQEFCDNVEKKLPEIENINFKCYRDIRSVYTFYQDTIYANFYRNLFGKVKIYDWTKNRAYSKDELPESFYKDLGKVEHICDDLDIYDLMKDSLNKEIEFIFNIKYIKTETIPKWDKKLDGKEDDYDGYLVYDVNNIREKDNYYLKLKDKWYFEYYERRPN